MTGTDSLIEEAERVVNMLRNFGQAYPESVFPTPPEERRAKDSAAADVMRQLALPPMAQAAHVIERLLGFIELIPADRRHPWHTVTLNRTGWHLAHPITCVLEGCLFDRAVRIWAQDWGTSPLPDGSYRWADPSQLPTETMRIAVNPDDHS